MSGEKKPTRLQPWAIGIGAVVVLFPIVFAGMAVWISTIDVPLVRKDYYESDLRYQEEIDTRKRTAALEARPVLRFARDVSWCEVVFPDSARTPATSGSVRFYRPDGSTKDFDVPLALGPDGSQRIGLEQMRPGVWTVQLRWQSGGSEYYLEERVYKK